MNEPDSHKPWWEGDYVWRPEGADEPAPAEAEADRAEPAPALVQCWRCGQAVEQGRSRCPHCFAPFEAPRRRSRRRNEDDALASGGSGLVPMVWFFIGLLSVSLIYMLIAHAAVQEAQQNGNALVNERLMQLMVITEGVDTALVLIALAVVRPKRLPLRERGTRAAAWALAGPVWAGLLGLTLAYQRLLSDFLHLPIENPFGDGLTALVVLAVCVQPAIVEELFFRYLALGTLRQHMGVHAAVLVSSVMFGMAHVGNPLAIPILIVVGMGIGYMRVLSGSLLLPMLMHFAHNLVIVLLG